MSRRFLRVFFPGDVNHVAGLRKELADCMPRCGRLLDLGCGVNTALAPYRTPEREVWGADFQAHPALQSAQWFRPLGADGCIPFPDGHFDLVLTVMVMEHVDDPVSFLREVTRVLRPGGCFIGHTISGAHYITGLRRVLGLLPHSLNQALVRRLYGRCCEDTFPAFYRLNTERAIRRVGEATALRLVRLQRYADSGYFRFWAPLQASGVLLDSILEHVCRGCGRLYLTATLRRRGETDGSMEATNYLPRGGRTKGRTKVPGTLTSTR